MSEQKVCFIIVIMLEVVCKLSSHLFTVEDHFHVYYLRQSDLVKMCSLFDVKKLKDEVKIVDRQVLVAF